MRVFERGIMVVQGNVTNASTPGYARQRQVLSAMASDLDAGLAGGVASGGTADLRSTHAEQSVRRSLNLLGQAGELTAHLSRMEPVFDVQEGAGVGGAIQSLFEAFSALAVAPNDGSARQVALQSAGNLALAFRQAAAGLNAAQADAGRGLVTEAAAINSTLQKIQQINHQFKQDFRAQNDAGLSAQFNTLLEDLSESMDFTMLRAPDGSVSIYAGGQSPVLMGERLYEVTADVSGIPARLLDHQGADILGQLTGGRVAALDVVYNDRIPGYLADFDRLAAALADAVNNQLSAGLDASGNPPAADLFTYNPTLGAARTLAVNDLSTSDLAAASVGAPGGNGNAVSLAALASERLVAGTTFTQYYGAIAARAGRDLSAAQADQAIQSALSVQARQMRDDISKVNLDEEAITLLEFQRAYEAAARMVMTLDEMTKTLFEMIR